MAILVLQVHDNDTRCLVQTGQLPNKSSRMGLTRNANGSVDLYFGPTLRDRKLEKNRVKMVPGQGWFTHFRLHAPTERQFDRSWQLPDIEKID